MPGLPNIPQATILAAVEKLGPCQPLDIYREVKQGDTMLIGAMLSEIVAEGKLAISKTRKGGSPFYYDPQKPERLEMISRHLKEKDRRTYEMLKEQQVMREDTQEPLVRVGLQQGMPDFSKRMTVDIDGEEIVFWRHYMTDEDEATRLAKGGKRKENKKKETKDETEEKKEDVIKSETKTQSKETTEESVKKEIEEETKPTKKTKTKKSLPSQTGRQEIESPSEKTDPMIQEKDIPETKPADAPAAKEAKPKKERKTGKKKAEEPTIMPDGADMISPQEWLAHDTLYAKVERFAAGMQLRDGRVHKPHSELSCIMSVQAPFGAIDMFVHAFNKKFTPDDIKAGLTRARELGLPTLILSVDPIPSKITAVFKGMPNIFFKTFEEKQKS